MSYKANVAQTLFSQPKTWIDSADLGRVGGLDSSRRVRELRAEGLQIKTRRNPENPTTFQYQLSRMPAKRVVNQYV